MSNNQKSCSNRTIIDWSKKPFDKKTLKWIKIANRIQAKTDFENYLEKRLAESLMGEVIKDGL